MSLLRSETKFTTVQQTVTAGAYSTGQLVGGKITFTGATNQVTGKGIITSALVIDQAKNGVAYDLVVFSSNPTGTTFTDNATLDIADADMAKICAIVSFATTDAVGFNDNGISYKGALAYPVFSVKADGSPTLMYGALIARGSPTYAATTDVAVTIAVLCD